MAAMSRSIPKSRNTSAAPTHLFSSFGARTIKPSSRRAQRPSSAMCLARKCIFTIPATSRSRRISMRLPAPSAIFSAGSWTVFLLRSAEFPVPQEHNRLLDRGPIPYQPWVRGLHNDMIGHAVELGVLDRHPPLLRFGQECRADRIDRPVACDDADRIIRRGKQRFDRIVPLGAELLSGGSEEGAVGPKILQPVGDFTAAVRCAQHHDAAQAFRPMPGNVDAGQQPAHGMADEMNGAVDAIGKGPDGGMNVLG